MAKGKTVYFCKECGYETSKWMGQCPGCRQWNTLVEERVTRTSDKKSTRGISPSKVTGIFQVSMEKEDRISSGMPELDRVLGGGIVKGSLTLVGGDPGIGKSTLLLQICRHLSCLRSFWKKQDILRSSRQRIPKSPKQGSKTWTS